MILYHYTSLAHLRGIAKHGLTIGDVPTDLRKNAGRVGIWLTSSTNPTGHGLAGASVDKGRYRLSVQIDDRKAGFVRWSEWAPGNVTTETIENLKECAGKDGPSQWQTWFIHFPPIPVSQIVACHDRETGEPILGWDAVYPAELSCKAIPSWKRDAWHRQMLKRYAARIRSVERRGLVVVY